MKTSYPKISAYLVILALLFTFSAFSQVSVTPSITNACNSGSVTFAVTGGGGSYTYDLYSTNYLVSYPIQSSPTFVSIPAGEYEVDVYSNGIYAGSDIFSIGALANLQMNPTNPTCAGNNGTISLSNPGGAALHSYLWSTGSTNSSVNGLTAGQYNVTVTDINGCSATDSTYLSVDSMTVFYTSGQPTCNEATGYIFTSVYGGSGIYSYQWSNATTGDSLVNIPPGTYSVTVSDGTGCVATESISLSGVPIQIDSIYGVTYSECNTNTGSVQPNIYNGITPYHYHWSTGSASASLLGLAPGSYSLTVTDGGGCTGSVTYSVYTDQPSVYLYAGANPSCSYADGVLYQSTYGGTGSYTYHWSNGTTADSLGAVAAGTYSLTVTDAGGCTATGTTALTAGPLLIDTGIGVIDASCTGNNGAISIHMGSGRAPYHYHWYNGTTASTLNNLTPGSYDVTVTDGTGCVGTATYNVYQSQIIAQINTIGSPTCGTADGELNAVVTGGNGLLAYSWSTSATTDTVHGLAPGQYSVTATDADGCTASQNIFISSGPLDVDSSSVITYTGCSPGGTITIHMQLGVSPFSFAWSSGGTDSILIGASGPTYTVTVTDASGCMGTASYSLSNPNAITADFQNVINPDCGSSDGSIVAMTDGGTGSDTYLWSTGATADQLNNIAAGTYSLTITDADGCTATTNINLTNAPLLIDQGNQFVTNPSCTANNGSITVYMDNGVPPYTYLWSNASTDSFLTGLGTGDYRVNVTDSRGCTGSADYYLSPPNQIYAELYPLNNPICNTPTGSIQAYVEGGTRSDTYLWSTGSTLDTLSNVPPGNYAVTVTDANGCVDSERIVLTSAGLVADTNTTAVINPGCTSNDGSITVYPYGGVSPYSYLWSTSAIATANDSIAGLDVGTYTVTVSDANSCSGTATFTLTRSQVTADIVTLLVPTCTNPNGSLQVVAAGGDGVYTYSWSNASTNIVISGLQGGPYSVTATDNNGCSASQNTYLASTPLIIDSIQGVTYPTCNSTGAIYPYVDNSNGPFTYLWSNSTTGDSLVNIPAGSYSLTVTDGTGCTGTINYDLYSYNQISAIICSFTDPDCGMADGNISICANGGSGYYSYLWSNNTTGDSLVNIAAGNYSVTVSDQYYGCTAAVSQSLVATLANFLATISVTPTACDTALYTGSATAIASGPGTPPYTFTWYEFGNVIGTGPAISNLPYGSFVTVSITDSNGCSPAFPSGDTAGIPLDPACYDHITGYVYNDANGNCMLDNGEAGLQNVNVSAVGSQTFYGNPDSTGFYDILVTPGRYIVSPNPLYNGACLSSFCPGADTVTFTGTGQVASYINFGTAGPAFDLGVHVGYIGSMPGSQKEYWVYYYNYSNVTVYNAVLTFTYDPSIILSSTTPAYTSINTAAHTITWDLDSVPAGWNWQQVTMLFNIPVSLPTGTLLAAQAEIEPIAGDCDPADNIQSVSDSVGVSHDPNSKEVSPAGNLSATDTVLTYTIRFQNTGTAPATLVIVSDTLSPNVNPASVIPGASSAPYKYSLSGNGVITFTFQPINLPDSASDPIGSQGFVMYSVHTKKDLPLGTRIDNTAFVYFDANPAVVTNTTVNIRSNYPNGIANITNNKMTAEVVPNPAHDIALIEFNGASGSVALEITDELGNIITTTNVDTKSYALDAGSLAPGIYFYTAKDAIGNRATGKISVVR